MSNLDNLNTKGSIDQTNKSFKFIENSKKTVRDVLTKTGIVINTILPTATTSPTIIPTSINTLTPIASTTIKAIGLGTATSLFTACGRDEDSPDGPVNPIDTKDTIAPTIEVNKSEIDITGGKEIKISGNQLYIGGELIASRSDNKTTNCNVSLSLNGKSITSGTTISEEGTLTIKVSDTAGNSKNTNIKLTLEQDISGLESLKNLNMQVDQEINLLNGVSFGNGAELIKVEMELDGEKVEISDPYHYVPAYPGICNIIITVKDKNGKSTEYKTDNLTIKPLEYKAVEIINIKPEEILPIVGRDKIQTGDRDVYKYVEHLRIAECTKIRDMMREYGAGNHNAEQYQKLMMRLNTGMTMETPKGYDNYEALGGTLFGEPSYHAHDERNILNTLINHTNFKISNPNDTERFEPLENETKNNPNNIYIFGNSASGETNKEGYLQWDCDRQKALYRQKNFLLFAAGGNIGNGNDGLLKNKIYQENINETDKHGIYSLPSTANGKNDNNIDRHLLVTVGTNYNGDIDQTDEIVESSKFPVGFHDKVLFAGRAFPYLSGATNKISGEAGKYATSYTNYFNVAIASILFQMKADTPDVYQLLEMIRSTALTDHIRFDLNGDGDTNDTYQGQPETQPLLLMNPAGFFEKYLMPTDLPSSIQSSKAATLNKGYYKGVIFDIPGAEVKINGQWMAYNDTNKSQIKNQNPMTLEWRINGDLCKKLGYKGKNIEGKIIVVDDKWNGLNIKKDFSISVQ